MIDHESDIFNIVYEKVIEKYPDISITSEYVPVPTAMPHISLYQYDNAIYRNSASSSTTENVTAIVFNLDVYSNKVDGKKQEAKELTAFVDDILIDLGFVRRFSRPVPNINDNTIYRITGRYRCLADENYIYRR